jgi:hypothetical protein
LKVPQVGPAEIVVLWKRISIGGLAYQELHNCLLVDGSGGDSR